VPPVACPASSCGSRGRQICSAGSDEPRIEPGLFSIPLPAFSNRRELPHGSLASFGSAVPIHEVTSMLVTHVGQFTSAHEVPETECLLTKRKARRTWHPGYSQSLPVGPKRAVKLVTGGAREFRKPYQIWWRTPHEASHKRNRRREVSAPQYSSVLRLTGELLSHD
jgi:hypothetical protein